jgi:RNA polymerase sigma factor (sigma-70 family)
MATNIIDKSRWRGEEAEDELRALVCAAAAGETDALSRLLNHSAFQLLVNNACRSVYRKFSDLGTNINAEDLRQEVFLRLMKQSERLQKIPADIRFVGAFIRVAAENILLERMSEAKGRGDLLGTESRPRRRIKLSPRRRPEADLAAEPRELRAAAISELESLSSFLDSEPDSIDSMSATEVEEELRELGLNANKPLFEASAGVTMNLKRQNVIFLLNEERRAGPRTADGDESIRTYARGSINWRTGGRERHRWQIFEDEESATSTVVQEKSREADHGAVTGGGPRLPPPEDESFIDTLEKEFQNEFADPLFQVLSEDAEFQRTLDTICKRLLPLGESEYSPEDLKQDVLIKFGRWLWRYRYEASFGKVLERIARNQLVDMRRPAEAQAVSLEELLPVEFGVEPEPPARPSKNAQVAQQVSQWLDALKEDERRLFVSHLLEGRTLADIARELGVTRQAVSKRWVKSLNKLRPLLADSVSGRA